MSRKTVLIVDEEADWYAEMLEGARSAFVHGAATEEAEAIGQAAEAHVLIGMAPALSARLVSATPRLEWIQALSSGIESLLLMPISTVSRPCRSLR